MESADYCDNAINICPTADCLSLRPTATAYGRREEKKRGLCKEEQKCRCAEGSIRVRGVVGRLGGEGRKEEERTRSQVSSFTTGLALVFEIRE